MEWEKISANDETNKGLITKTLKQLIELKKTERVILGGLSRATLELQGQPQLTSISG